MKPLKDEKAYRDDLGAIVFDDSEAQKAARIRKQRIEEEREKEIKMELIENRINNLESKIDSILSKLEG